MTTIRVSDEQTWPVSRHSAVASASAVVAMSAELTGVCQRALDMTVGYVKERRQFGTPVGAFQAVSHRCAEMLLATEGSRSATYAAAWAADAGDESRYEYALVAKAAAVTGIIVNPRPMPRTNKVPASNTSLVDEVTKANGIVAAAINKMPNGTMRRAPTRSVMLPAQRMMQAAPMPCGAINSPATQASWPRAIW